jgi:hypothetical protein
VVRVLCSIGGADGLAQAVVGSGVGFHAGGHGESSSGMGEMEMGCVGKLLWAAKEVVEGVVRAMR